jgi:hypothetical protein
LLFSCWLRPSQGHPCLKESLQLFRHQALLRKVVCLHTLVALALLFLTLPIPLPLQGGRLENFQSKSSKPGVFALIYTVCRFRCWVPPI